VNPTAKAGGGKGGDAGLTPAQQAARNRLDAQTMQTIDDLEWHDRKSVLDDLLSKPEVRNPSAYVSRAVTNMLKFKARLAAM
jgi:hypothetical protein